MDLPRQTIELLITFKKHLEHYGVTVSLTAGDVPLQLLNASVGIEDDLIQQYRERLQQLFPPGQCICPATEAAGQLTHDLGSPTLRLGTQANPYVSTPTLRYVTCPCGKVLHALLEDHREYPRHPAHLPGVYFSEEGRGHMAEMVVEDISYGGVRLRLLAAHEIACQDQLLIHFILDDEAQAVISECIGVRYVQGQVIGGEFVNTSTLNHALAIYLGINWVVV